MDCQACNGTGDGRKFGDRNCSICNGSGSVCDVCGEVVDAGECICRECLAAGHDKDGFEEAS